jgi:4a-hydroxytetrahydrobiopterin dehydratase
MMVTNKEIRVDNSMPGGWQKQGDEIVKEFKFDDFKQAFAFMTQAAGVAEKINHHPEWTNVYNKVTIKLTTHDEGGVTKKDIELAREMNRLAGE